MMYIIFSFSAQTGEVSGNLSYKISYQIVETKNELLNTGKSYEELAYEAEQIHYYVRKAAHMTEYCLLCLLYTSPVSITAAAPLLPESVRSRTIWTARNPHAVLPVRIPPNTARRILLTFSPVGFI